MIKIDENNNKVVTYDNDPNIQRELFPNIPYGGDTSELEQRVDAIEGDIADIQQALETYDGQPGVAKTVSDMADTSKIYVYVGDEAGYVSGDWYYYDGTEWVSGGAYVANPVVIDDTLTQAGEAADAKATGDALAELKSDFDELEEAVENKANIDGSYDTLTAGNAEQLISTQVVQDKVPYLFRTSGGSADIGNRENDMIVGGSIVFNQLADNENTSGSHFAETWASTVSISDGEITVTNTRDFSQLGFNFVEKNVLILSNHVYLCAIDVKSVSFDADSVVINITDNWNNCMPTSLTFAYTGTGRYATIGKTNASGTPGNNQRVLIRLNGDVETGDTAVFENCMWIDLTAMFGTTIADYIYSLETATPGAGVAWFRKLFPKDYYDYDAGTLMHVSGLSAHEMVGFNQWDEQWELGSISSSTGENVSGTTTIRSKNYIPVVPNAEYYYRVSDYTTSSNIAVRYYDADKNFIGVNDADGLGGGAGQVRTMPSNACYIRFYIPSAAEYGTTYKNDICINLSWSGTHNGEYEPYKKNSYPLDDSLTLRGIPKLDAENNLYYDGDTYEADGTVTRRYGEYTFTGNEDFTKYTSGIDYTYYCTLSRHIENFAVNNHFILPGYVNTNAYNSTNMLDMTTKGDSTRAMIFIRDSSCPTVADLLQKLTGRKLLYELATPTTETADPYQDPQVVDDWGTEEYVSISLVPVGHDTKYPANLRDKLQHLPDLADSDGYYAIKQVGTQMSLELFRIPKAPTEDGTYTLKATVTSGTPVYTWEEVTE